VKTCGADRSDAQRASSVPNISTFIEITNMKKLLASLTLGLSLLLGSTAIAQTPAAPAASEAAPMAAMTEAKPAEAPAAAPAMAPAAPVAAEAAPAPVPNKGDPAWRMVSTLQVILMTVPGLALFYGGLVRSKNMLSVLMQVMVTFSLIVVLWFIYGYSLAFTEGNAFFGGFDRLFMAGVWGQRCGHFCQWRHFQQGRGHSRDCVCRFPGDLCRHHRRTDRGCLCRTHEVFSRADVHGAVVHFQLRPDCPHGVVLDGP
jgi:hypothetical protein